MMTKEPQESAGEFTHSQGETKTRGIGRVGDKKMRPGVVSAACQRKWLACKPAEAECLPHMQASSLVASKPDFGWLTTIVQKNAVVVVKQQNSGRIITSGRIE